MSIEVGGGVALARGGGVSAFGFRLLTVRFRFFSGDLASAEEEGTSVGFGTSGSFGGSIVMIAVGVLFSAVRSPLVIDVAIGGSRELSQQIGARDN